MNTMLRVKDYLLTAGRTDLAEIVSATSTAHGMQKAELRAEIDKLRAELEAANMSLGLANISYESEHRLRLSCETALEERDAQLMAARAELAELRARAGELERQVRDKHEAATVDEICNAYESGVGHRGRPTASVNPYRQGSDLATAYNIGALGDRESPATAGEGVRKMELTTTQMRAGFGSSLGRASQIAAYHAALNNAADQIETLRAELAELRARVPAICFPRQPNGEGGWVIDANYVAAIHKDCFPIEWQPCEEEVEAVLLAVERAAPVTPAAVPDDVAKDAHRVHAIGLAVNRAARDLPDGYEIRIEIERDAGTVRLYSPDDEVIDHEWDGETFAGEIESAVVAAILSADTEVKK